MILVRDRLNVCCRTDFRDTHRWMILRSVRCVALVLSSFDQNSISRTEESVPRAILSASLRDSFI
jgi:hypothetical protein